MMETDLSHSLRILFMVITRLRGMMRGVYGRMTWILADPVTHLAKLGNKLEGGDGVEF